MDLMYINPLNPIYELNEVRYEINVREAEEVERAKNFFTEGEVNSCQYKAVTTEKLLLPALLVVSRKFVLCTV